MVLAVIEAVYRFLWGDLFTIPIGNGNGIGIPLLVLLLIPTGIYFTIRTKFLPVRLFPDMIRALGGKKKEEGGLSPVQTLFVSTATRVGMGNLVGVVAAISAGGAGAVFWMWISAIFGSSTAFVEAALGASIQRKRSALRRISRRSGLLYPQLCGAREKKEIETLRRCRFVCAVRSDLLGWDQPGHQQFGGIGI